MLGLRAAHGVAREEVVTMVTTTESMVAVGAAFVILLSAVVDPRVTLLLAAIGITTLSVVLGRRARG